MTKVIHIRDTPPDWQNNPNYVYIGRAGKGNDGYFGNSHPVGYCSRCSTVHDRDGACEAFREDFERKVLEDDEFRNAVYKLQSKTLVCFCSPKRCHGDVYVEFLNRYM